MQYNEEPSGIECTDSNGVFTFTSDSRIARTAQTTQPSKTEDKSAMMPWMGSAIGMVFMLT
jgi:hypothetical protein